MRTGIIIPRNGNRLTEGAADETLTCSFEYFLLRDLSTIPDLRY
jgi:hypothetical protein